MNSLITDFFVAVFPLPHTCHFKTRPISVSKINGSAFGAHFLQLYRKNEYRDPHFLFFDFNKNSASFPCEKIGINLTSAFFAILLNSTDCKRVE